MGTSANPRYERKYDNITDDSRPRGARDRDRVLYTGAFFRLAGVTQVASPLDSHLFHSRLTHSLEVSQIGRRISERLLSEKDAPAGLSKHLDPDVVETACLIHDLGHPPFGHIAEEELDRLARKEGNLEGFEGNAQSFRIVTRLAVHGEYDGLDLIRATLNATLKYPWPRNLKNPTGKRYFKFGYYKEDRDVFDWVRKYSSSDIPCLEAQIMNYADDISYSIHDIIDFYRAGLLPLGTLLHDTDEFVRFVDMWKADTRNPIPKGILERTDKYQKLLNWFLVSGEYNGTKDQRVAIRRIATAKIREYVKAARIEVEKRKFILKLDDETNLEIKFLQRVFFHYLILNPRLTTQQHGQRKIIEFLFKTYFDATSNPKDHNLIPGRFQHFSEAMHSRSSKKERARLAVDIVSSFTDSQALAMFMRLNGNEPGAITDIIAW